ncbi:type I polyketide synthase [Saccharothrix luteola]|uniref:type I polyketide synthase n=1 Tax=Saccharothrix luteola TaxID=2893018 RepID=UPI001E2959F7|nr:type I polyketide synthase [Saccharothrix luteola]MCC8250392.1 SDR family NAD(P)-dependent oxidoreductase [Saccharothrix luteola]
MTPIAVVGMSCAFPGAPDLDAYWRVIAGGRETVRRFSPDDLRAAGLPEAELRRPDFVAAGGVVAGGEEFDARFFGCTAREAGLMDPQQRQFLQCSWHAMEDAGHAPATFPGSVGVFAGQSASAHGRESFRGDLAESLPAANDKDFLATRVAYQLGLTGPAIVVQAACSTSLVAVHVACGALAAGQCDLALAGGVSWRSLRAQGYRHRPGGALSVDGHVRPFDRAATGFVPADGVGVVVLRRLDDAVAAGDRIYAVVRGGAVNNDGADRSSYVAPGMAGRTAVIAAALADARVPPDTVGYVEAHGAATVIGDVIEVTALTQGYRGARGRLGSVKANIGHTDAAAGVAGFIKTALVLHHRRLPPNVNFAEPNPEIDFGACPFVPDPVGRDWPSAGHPRRAAVSAFGIGGTNAHLVLEEAPPASPPTPAPPWQLLALSAKDDAAVHEIARSCADGLADVDLADVAHTLARRTAFPRRAAVVARDVADARRRLLADRLDLRDADADRPAHVAFAFPGGGSQHVGMGRDLYRHEPVYRDALDECLDLMPAPLASEVRAVLFGVDDHHARAAIAGPRLGLPALFATGMAYGRLLGSLGVRPTTVLGHGAGEYAAACFAGVFTLADAVAVVVERGRVLVGVPDGAMIGVAASESVVAPLLGDGVALAAVNGRRMCVLSGPAPRIADVARLLAERGVACSTLPFTTAAHSALVDPVLPEFARFLADVPAHRPTTPLISSVDGHPLAGEATSPRYWVRQLREPVRFADQLDRVAALGKVVLVEVGPGVTLSTPARRHLPDTPVVATARHPDDGRSDREVFLGALGALWSTGVDVDLAGLTAGRRVVSLPGYPFARTRCVPETAPGDARPVLYGVGWRRAVDVPRPRPGGRWAVVSNGSPLVGDLVRHAWARGVDVVPDYASIRDALASRPSLIVHFAPEGLDLSPLTDLARSGADVTLALVTAGAFDVTGGERVRPSHAALVAAGLTLAAEHRAVGVRAVDVVDTDAGALVRELLDPDGAELVALRAGRRWTRHYEPVPAVAGPPPRPGGVHVITGGLGGIGRLLSRHLVRAYRGRVALIGRSAPVTRPPDGARWWQADVADRAALTGVLRRVRDELGPITGVVHAAGVAGHGPTGSLTAGVVETALAAKVDGTRALLHALDAVGAEPDYVALFSSLAALVGAPGQPCYAAANAYLDACAGTGRVVAIDWDRWNDVGLARGVVDGGTPGLSVEHALHAFDSAVRAVPLGHLAVSTVHPDRLRPLVRAPAVRAGTPVEDLARVWADVFGVPEVEPGADVARSEEE